MATYAIGDIQGCYYAFQALIKRINFDEAQDQLWMVGDLINRGTGSLEVLRWCFEHQSSVRVVLGNHDLHALVVASGIRQPHRSDTLQSLYSASDGLTLLTWLRYQPLIMENNDYVMVHAGLLPEWTIDEALHYAKEVETALSCDDYMQFLNHMYGNHPAKWDSGLLGYDRLRVITNAFTRLRVCKTDGEMNFDFKGELADIPAPYMPWFKVPNRNSRQKKIICGHWSALGLHQDDNIVALDTGCLWGGHLTAFCLENQQITQVPFDPRDKA